jgi:hypothetical protein
VAETLSQIIIDIAIIAFGTADSRVSKAKTCQVVSIKIGFSHKIFVAARIFIFNCW